YSTTAPGERLLKTRPVTVSRQKGNAFYREFKRATRRLKREPYTAEIQRPWGLSGNSCQMQNEPFGMPFRLIFRCFFGARRHIFFSETGPETGWD
ncbi:MAG TPA: hypothetical protein VF507_10135, partial [Pyrinomonadaceae bacterium]